MASYDNKGINTTQLAKNLSEINGLTDSNNQEISEITLPKVITLNNKNYEINSDGNVYKYYNINGNILLLDGINNTRNGHSTTTTTWEDLSGYNNDFTKLDSASNPNWSDNSYVGDETNRTLVLNKSILENSNECTVEVCYDISKLKNYYWIFHCRQQNLPANGFQFYSSSNGRNVDVLEFYGNHLNSCNFTTNNNLNKSTMAFALNASTVTFAVNNQFYTENSTQAHVYSINARDCFSIGSAYPWSGVNHPFSGNIYSIRVYNRKLSEEELKNNYEVDRVRFNMD